jgi:hypothetical protein
VGSRTRHRILGLTLLTAGAGVAAGLAASSGAGPLAELPGHHPPAVPVSARTTASPSPLRADILFPTAAPAAPTEHTVYVQDPAPPPIIVPAVPTPASDPPATAPAAPRAPAGTAPPPPAAPVTAPPSPPPATARPRPTSRPCSLLFCGGGG